MINKNFGTPEWFEEAEKLSKKKRAALGDFTSVRGNVTTVTKNDKTGEKNTFHKEFATQYDYGNMTYDHITGTSYFYDEYDKDVLLCSIGNDKHGEQERFVYGFKDGKLISKTNTSKGFVITYEYDDNDHLIKMVVNYPNGVRLFTSYKYDKMGRLVESKSKYSTTTYKYDVESLIIETSIIKKLKDGSTKKTVTTSEYNEDGELIKEVSGPWVLERRYDNGACVYENKTLYGKTIREYSGVFGVDKSSDDGSEEKLDECDEADAPDTSSDN